MEIEKLISLIQDSLTPDLLKPAFRKENRINPLFGHCYVATEALFYLIREFKLYKYYNFKSYCGYDEANKITHWWLQNDLGDILDPTAGQYTSIGRTPPYAEGRRHNLLLPSKRSLVLVDRVLEVKNHSKAVIDL